MWARSWPHAWPTSGTPWWRWNRIAAASNNWPVARPRSTSPAWTVFSGRRSTTDPCVSRTTSVWPWTSPTSSSSASGTPPGRTDNPDMSAMQSVARLDRPTPSPHHIIVTKSTVPIGTGYWLGAMIEDLAGTAQADGLFSLVSNPEFLQEGSAVQDYLHPDRVVLGSDDPAAVRRVAEVYRPILEQKIPGDVGTRDPVPLLQARMTTAEMIKYASNAFLATKISFANEIARLCDYVGADVTEVTAGMGLDDRIGGRFLNAGLGWGGSCFGKDLAALVGTAAEYGYQPPLLQGDDGVNTLQRQAVVDELLRQLKTLRGSRICLLGPGLQARDGRPPRLPGPRRRVPAGRAGGVRHRVRPDGHGRARRCTTSGSWPDPHAGGDRRGRRRRGHRVAASSSPSTSTSLAKVMRGDVFYDCRNVFSPPVVAQAGFRYVGIGRPRVRRAGHRCRRRVQPSTPCGSPRDRGPRWWPSPPTSRCRPADRSTSTLPANRSGREGDPMVVALLELRQSIHEHERLYLFTVFVMLTWMVWLVKVVLSRRYRPWSEPFATTDDGGRPGRRRTARPVPRRADAGSSSRRRPRSWWSSTVHGTSVWRRSAASSTPSNGGGRRWPASATPFASVSKRPVGDVVVLVDSDTIWTEAHAERTGQAVRRRRRSAA